MKTLSKGKVQLTAFKSRGLTRRAELAKRNDAKTRKARPVRGGGPTERDGGGLALSTIRRFLQYVIARTQVFRLTRRTRLSHARHRSRAGIGTPAGMYVDRETKNFRDATDMAHFRAMKGVDTSRYKLLQNEPFRGVGFPYIALNKPVGEAGSNSGTTAGHVDRRVGFQHRRAARRVRLTRCMRRFDSQWLSDRHDCGPAP